jgi:hypothetical protein
MAQDMLNVNRPSCPMMVGTPNSAHMLLIPDEYAVVASPMNSVIKFSMVVMLRLYQGFQLKGFSLSPVAKVRTMYSLSSCLTISVKVKGMSHSTVLMAPQSESMSSTSAVMCLPPQRRPIMGSPFSFRTISEFSDLRSVSGSPSSCSLLFTLDRKPGVPGALLGAVFAAVFAAVTAAVCAAVVPAIVWAMEPFRGVAIEPFRGVAIEPARGVMGLLPGALRGTLYEELALEAASEPGLEGRP